MQTSPSHWHWFQTNWTYYFAPHYFNVIKIVTTFKCFFEETIPKLSVNFRIWKLYLIRLTRTNNSVWSVILVLLHHNTVINIDQICRLSAISFSLVTHTEERDYLHDQIQALVGLFWTSCHVLAWKYNNMASSLYQRIVFLFQRKQCAQKTVNVL